MLNLSRRLFISTYWIIGVAKHLNIGLNNTFSTIYCLKFRYKPIFSRNEYSRFC